MTDDQELTEALIYIEANGIRRELEQLVGATSHSVHRRFREHTTPDDIAQEMWTWVGKAPKKIARWHQDNSREGFQRLVAAVLYDEGTYYGRRTKAQALGYKLGEEFYYTRGMIERLLPSVFNRDDWVNLPAWAQNAAEGRSGKALNEGFGWVATLADVSRALSRLPKADQEVLRKTYAGGLTRAEYAYTEGIAKSTASDRHKAALKALWRELGGPKWLTHASDRAPDEEPVPYHQGRRAMSNAQARFITDQQMGHEESHAYSQ